MDLFNRDKMSFEQLPQAAKTKMLFHLGDITTIIFTQQGRILDQVKI